MKKLITEFVGTFFLVFTVGLVSVNNVAMAPIAIGAILMVMVYMGGHISGAHYNPAISIAFCVRGKMSNADCASYIITQLLAALAASGAVQLITGQTFAPFPGEGVGIGAALLVEVLFTMALALVIFNVATDKATVGNSYYGAAIGCTIMGAAFAGGSISGGAFNPAVGAGPTIVNALVSGGSTASLWLYLVGPVLGGILGATIYGIQETK